MISPVTRPTADASTYCGGTLGESEIFNTNVKAVLLYGAET